MCDDTFTEDLENILTYASNIIEDNEDVDQPLTPTTPRSKSRSKQGRHSHFFICEDHDNGKAQWSTSVNGKCDKCIIFPKLDSLPPGKLPTKYEVLCYILSKGDESRRCGQSLLWNVLASNLALHWIFCNVYPKTLTSIRSQLKKCKEEYDSLKKCPKTKRSKTHFLKLDAFIQSSNNLFDIVGDYHQTKRQEKIWNVMMTEEDRLFYKNQSLNPRVGYCTTFVCRKSEIKDMRRANRKEKEKIQQENVKAYQETMKPIPLSECGEDYYGSDSDTDFCLDPPEKKKI